MHGCLIMIIHVAEGVAHGTIQLSTLMDTISILTALDSGTPRFIIVLHIMIIRTNHFTMCIITPHIITLPSTIIIHTPHIITLLIIMSITTLLITMYTVTLPLLISVTTQIIMQVD